MAVKMTPPKLSRRELQAARAILNARDALPAPTVTVWRLLAEAKMLHPELSERTLIRALARLERAGIMKRVDATHSAKATR